MTDKAWKDHWEPGETAWFEYHCYEGHDSADAPAWYRSHQKVTVLGIPEAQEDFAKDPSTTFEDRAEACLPRVYTVRFPDGLEWGAWEDELHTTREAWHRPDPPPAPAEEG